MKQRLLMAVFFLMIGLIASSQDINVLLKEADNLEKQLKETAALEKYKQILLLESGNIKALVKATELHVNIGGREKDKGSKKLYYESALSYAKRAFDNNNNNADAAYAMALANGKLVDVETENKKIVAYVKEIKIYADKAVTLNPNHARANYTLGKWHYEMVTLSGLKKAAVKLFYGGLPDGDIDQAILYMEKCKTIEPYFAPNYLDLGKAYKEASQPAKAIEVLSKLVKLPTRSSEDIAIKAEGAQLLQSLQ
jgi:effector-binding domain-containing protein